MKENGLASDLCVTRPVEENLLKIDRFA